MRPRFQQPVIESTPYFSQPPPNLVSPSVTSESYTTLRQNIPSLLTLQVNSYNQQKRKSFCSACEIWTIEPYEFHIDSEMHMKNKTKEKHDTADNKDRFVQPNMFSNVESYDDNYNTQINVPKPIIRYGPQPRDNIDSSQRYIPKKNMKRPFNQNEQIKSNFQSVGKKSQDLVNFGDGKSISPNEYIPQREQCANNNTKVDILNKNNNNLTKPNNSINEISNENGTILIGNVGRDRLVHISGVFCTLCEEFFRNTDSAEKLHCESSSHLLAYEKLLAQLKELPDNKTGFNSIDDVSFAKRLSSSNTSKISGTYNTSPEVHDIVTKAGIDTSAATKESIEFDQSSYTEYQAPDYSLDFPEEPEDYDE